MKNNNDPLRGFMKRLVDMAIQASIQRIFWKMPMLISIIVLIVLAAIAIIFKLY